jgi:hypothetical protein
MAITPNSFLRAALAVCAVLAALACASTSASAQTAKRGPGPFTEVGSVRDGRVVLKVAAPASRAVPFAPGATLAASIDGVTWTPFATKASIGGNGTRLTQTGTVGGLDVDAFFLDETQRRLRVRNPDGATTELDVVRLTDALLVLTANRTPDSLVNPGQGFGTGTKTVDALDDRDLTIAVSPESAGAPGYDVVVATASGPAPESVVDRSVSLTAMSDDTGESYLGTANFTLGVSGAVFTHLTLPPGAYTFRAVETATLGNPALSTTAVTVVYESVLRASVASDARLYAVTLPALQLPSFVDASLTLDGIDGLDATFAERYRVGVALVSTDGLARVDVFRDVGGPDALAISFDAPPGQYRLEVTAYRGATDANGVTVSLRFALGVVEVGAGELRAALPPMARLTGSVLDPDFTLASEPDPATNTTPSQAVQALSEDGSGAFQGIVYLGGFARSYALLVPREEHLALSAIFTAAVGKHIDRARSSENDTALLYVGSVGSIGPCVDGCDVDVTAPALPGFVRISGKVVDARGKPVQAFVSARRFANDSGTDVTTFAFVLTSPSGDFRMRLPRGAEYHLFASRFR